MSSIETAADRFRTTLWTVVLAARETNSPECREALETLIRLYWKPLYGFIRRRGHDPEASKDITQGFFTALIEKNYLQTVDRDKGKFRSFLLAAFRHYAADEVDRSTALKRGGGHKILPMDFEQAESEGLSLQNASESPDQAFLRDWAVQVLAQAFSVLKEEYASTGRSAEFEVLQGHLGRNSSSASYADLAQRLNLSENDARNRLHRARVHLRGAILRVVRAYSADEETVQDEVRDLFSAFMA